MAFQYNIIRIFEEEKAAGREAGLAEGRTVGHALGIAEGRAEGRAEGMSKAQIEIAGKMLETGMTVEQIMQLTGLDKETVESLKI